MTREEIIDYIKEELAKEEPEIYLDADDYKVILEALSAEPCEDAVSKQSLQTALLDEELDQAQGKSGRELCQIVEALPSVQPKIAYPSYILWRRL